MRKLLQKIINLSALILLTFFVSGSALILLNIMAPETYSRIRNNIIISPLCNAVEIIADNTGKGISLFYSLFPNEDDDVPLSLPEFQQNAFPNPEAENNDKPQSENGAEVLSITITEENTEEYWKEEVSLLNQYMVNSGYDFADYNFLSEIKYNGTDLNYAVLVSDGWIPTTSAESYKIMLENTKQKYGGAAYLYVSDGSSKKITSADLEENGIAEIDVDFSCPLSLHGIGVGSTAEELFAEFGRPYFCQMMCVSCEEEPTVWWVYRAEENNTYIIVEFIINIEGVVSEISYSSGSTGD